MESLSEKKTVVMPEGMIVIHNKLISLMMTLFSHFFLTSVRADGRLNISYIVECVCFCYYTYTFLLMTKTLLFNWIIFFSVLNRDIQCANVFLWVPRTVHGPANTEKHKCNFQTRSYRYYLQFKNYLLQYFQQNWIIVFSVLNREIQFAFAQQTQQDVLRFSLGPTHGSRTSKYGKTQM